MNVLSLFDGMSCGQQALKELGVRVDNYYASEIDKYAIEIAKKNFPNTIHVGDVTELKGANLPQIDLLMGGSPCQGFSFAGKQLNFNDPRSALFFEFVRVMKETKPKYFLLENVRMKQEYQDVITAHMGVKPIMINSSLLSAQNRVRLYWTNIPNIEQPTERGIVLKDVLEETTEEKYKISSAKVDRVLNSPRGKGFFYDEDSNKIGTVVAGYHKEPTDGSYIVSKPIQVGNASDINGHDMIKRIYSSDGKSPALTTMQGGNTQPKVSIRDTENYYQLNREGAYPNQQQDRIRKPNKPSNTLTSGASSIPKVMLKGLQYRKLTPLECERLQTLPDNYTEGVSNTQRYKMIGNGWTIEVIKHILNEMQ